VWFFVRDVPCGDELVHYSFCIVTSCLFYGHAVGGDYKYVARISIPQTGDTPFVCVCVAIDTLVCTFILVVEMCPEDLLPPLPMHPTLHVIVPSP
jgi:hypothetical protein